MESVIWFILLLNSSVKIDSGFLLLCFSFHNTSNSSRAFSLTVSNTPSTYFLRNSGVLPFFTQRCSLYSSSVNASEPSTSNEEEVTPPLLAEASLKIITPFFSKANRACCVRNKFAPSAIYLKRGTPFSSSNCFQF